MSQGLVCLSCLVLHTASEFKSSEVLKQKRIFISFQCKGCTILCLLVPPFCLNVYTL